MFHSPARGRTARYHAQTQRTGTVYFRFRSEPAMLENGWTFDDSFPGATGDTLINMNFCISFISTPIHTTADGYCSRAVGQKEPHHRQQRISEIIRMFNTAFDALGAKAGDYTHQPCKRKLTNLTAGFMTP